MSCARCVLLGRSRRTYARGLGTPLTFRAMRGARRRDKPTPSQQRVKEEELPTTGSGRGAETALAKLKQIERIRSRLRPTNRDGPSSA